VVQVIREFNRGGQPLTAAGEEARKKVKTG